MIDLLVPVYNVEKYLDRCLASVLAQTDTNYRIILLDDCSTDSSYEIAKKYLPLFDGRMELYQNDKNGGLSYTRNNLLDLSTNKYVCFIDSDDSINPMLVAELNKAIQETGSDLIKFQAYLIKSGIVSDKYKTKSFTNLSGDEALEWLLDSGKLFSQSWMYCYNKDLFYTNNIFFPEGKIHEDYAITSWLIFNTPDVSSIDYFGYNYYRNPNSIMENKSAPQQLKKAYDLLSHYDVLVDEFSSSDITPVLFKKLIEHLQIGLRKKVNGLEGKNKTEYIQQLINRNVNVDEWQDEKV